MKLVLCKFFKTYTRLRHYMNDNTNTLCGKKPIEFKEVEPVDMLGQVKPICATCSWAKKAAETTNE